MPTHCFRIARSGAAGVTITRAYQVTLDERMTVLDGLFQIQRELDPSLAFRCSCRVGMCGTCAMLVNYQPRLACQTRVRTLDSDVIHLAPLDHLPVMRDLVVDLEPFFEKWKAIKPALHPIDRNSKVLAIVPPASEFGQQAQGKRDCITCGACYSACSITGSSGKYLGPAAINRGLLRLLDPRDGEVEQRVKVLNAEQGVWRCHTQFNCVAACPKNINLTDSIVRLKRAFLRGSKKFLGGKNKKLAIPPSAIPPSAIPASAIPPSAVPSSAVRPEPEIASNSAAAGTAQALENASTAATNNGQHASTGSA